MELKTVRETLYGGNPSRKLYSVYLKGNRIATGPTREEAVSQAKQALFDAYENIAKASVVRVAMDGTVLVFRRLSEDTAMYEFHRNGKPASGICMGRMSVDGGMTYVRDLGEYADYVVGQYNHG